MTIRQYGPGKFNSHLEAAVYHVSLGGGPDQECGESESTGWFGLMRWDQSEAMLDCVRDSAIHLSDHLTLEEMEKVRDSCGVIMMENNEGFVEMEWFELGCDQRMADEWDDIENHVAESDMVEQGDG